MDARREPTQRFSDRVDYYVRSRPAYPPEVVEALRADAGLGPGSVIADVGSGTGILSRVFLDAECIVYGVEPNVAMRRAAETAFAGRANFTSVDGRAEATSLQPSSVDFVTAGQAFHWFQPRETKREFVRILKPGGWVAIIWNTRRPDSTPFLRDYEELLLAFSLDYSRITHTNISSEMIEEFLGPYISKNFPNYQHLDFEGLTGRLLSSSYVPMSGHPNYKRMMAELRRIFDLHQRAGTVTVEYDTQMYYAKIA